MTRLPSRIAGVSRLGLFLSAGVVLIGAARHAPAHTQATSAVTAKELITRTLPPGDFRDVRAITVDLGPGASAARHRHDVAVLAYVLEGTVENQFDSGPKQIHKTGDTWWEAPGTVHDLARNTSATAPARLLVVYIGEKGKTATVPLH